jgi:alkanesulfonate monooxygenase SsuD/methylene tetrahydromethanopterin reductase-like flavin-dependent oxidoreductase (luciferase family)
VPAVQVIVRPEPRSRVIAGRPSGHARGQRSFVLAAGRGWPGRLRAPVPGRDGQPQHVRERAAVAVGDGTGQPGDLGRQHRLGRDDALQEAYASYQDFVEGSQLESRVSLEEYSVSNRGLRSGLVGTPDQIADRLHAYERAGVGLMLLQFSPQREEMARFGRDVISHWS